MCGTPDEEGTRMRKTGRVAAFMAMAFSIAGCAGTKRAKMSATANMLSV
jgi:hypothetical protein